MENYGLVEYYTRENLHQYAAWVFVCTLVLAALSAVMITKCGRIVEGLYLLLLVASSSASWVYLLVAAQKLADIAPDEYASLQSKYVQEISSFFAVDTALLNTCAMMAFIYAITVTWVDDKALTCAQYQRQTEWVMGVLFIYSVLFLLFGFTHDYWTLQPIIAPAAGFTLVFLLIVLMTPKRTGKVRDELRRGLANKRVVNLVVVVVCQIICFISTLLPSSTAYIFYLLSRASLFCAFSILIYNNGRMFDRRLCVGRCNQRLTDSHIFDVHVLKEPQNKKKKREEISVFATTIKEPMLASDHDMTFSATKKVTPTTAWEDAESPEIYEMYELQPRDTGSRKSSTTSRAALNLDEMDFHVNQMQMYDHTENNIDDPTSTNEQNDVELKEVRIPDRFAIEKAQISLIRGTR